MGSVKIVLQATATPTPSPTTVPVEAGATPVPTSTPTPLPTATSTPTPTPFVENPLAKNLQAEAVTKGDAPQTAVENNKTDLFENLLTEEEQEAVANGEEAKVWLEVESISRDALEPDVAEAIDYVAKEVIKAATEHILIIDANLFTQVGERDSKQVSNPDTEIELTMIIPEDVVGSGSEDGFSVIRVHENVVSVISGKFNPITREFTFKTNQFSTYAVVPHEHEYGEWQTAVHSNGATYKVRSCTVYGCDNIETDPEDLSTLKAPEPKLDHVPKTEDRYHKFLLLGILAFAGLSVGAVFFKKKETK